MKDWVAVEPCEVRLDQLVTTKSALDLHTLLADDSTLYGDLFPHIVVWHGTMYLEDGLQRTLRSALQGRDVIHARVLQLDRNQVSCADQLGHANEAPKEA